MSEDERSVDDGSSSIEDREGEGHSAEDEESTALTRVRRKRHGVAAELDPEKLKSFEETDRRRGVVYVSRIPPFMKPVKLRHMLEQFAKIGRLYLAPEGASKDNIRMLDNECEACVLTLQIRVRKVVASRQVVTRSKCSQRRGLSSRINTRHERFAVL